MIAVDIGLSVMWGDCNIGADVFFENGNLYSWSEITTDVDSFTAIFAPVAIPSSHTSNLAEKIYGPGWRIPTKEQMLELMQYCVFEFAFDGKVIKATGPNGRSIFLPLANNQDWFGKSAKGGFYWTSTKAFEENEHAYQLRISDEITFGYNHIKVRQSVRPIFCP